MDSLISMRATGTPEEFAGKLNISRSTLFELLQEMKSLGVDIRYSQWRGSYYYGDDRRIVITVGRKTETMFHGGQGPGYAVIFNQAKQL